MRRGILVTGANKGIGLALTAQILAQYPDTHVFLGSRDLAKGKQAAQSLGDAAKRVDVVQLDVRDEASVKQAAESVKGKLSGSPLYAVVNNAGVYGSTHAECVDVNVHGPRRVVECFKSLLSAKDGSRVVNMASGGAPNFVQKCSDEKTRAITDPAITFPALEKLMQECLDIEAKGGGPDEFAAAGWGEGQAYGFSKACLNAYTMVLARELPGIRVNSCSPGFIETDMTRGFATGRGVTPAEMGMKQPKDGTVAPMHLLFGDLPASGWYYGSDAQRSPMHKYRAPGDPPYDGKD